MESREFGLCGVSPHAIAHPIRKEIPYLPVCHAVRCAVPCLVVSLSVCAAGECYIDPVPIGWRERIAHWLVIAAGLCRQIIELVP